MAVRRSAPNLHSPESGQRGSSTHRGPSERLFPAPGVRAEAKAQIVDPEGRDGCDGDWLPSNLFTIRPAAAQRSGTRRRPAVVLVAAPLPYVAEHIVEPRRSVVCRPRAEAAARVFSKPGDVVEVAISGASGSRRRAASPLRLVRSLYPSASATRAAPSASSSMT